MEFIRSLGDDHDDDVSHRGSSDAAFARTLSVGSIVTPLPHDRSHFRHPSDALLTPSSPTAKSRVKHTPLRHRPTTITHADYPRSHTDMQMHEANEEAMLSAAMRAMGVSAFAAHAAAAEKAAQGLPVSTSAAAEAQRKAELDALRASVSAERAAAERKAQATRDESVRVRVALSDATASAMDRGSYFRPHESGLVPPSTLAALGPAGLAQPLHSDLALSSLADNLAGFKKRDLFSSHARRTDRSRDEVVAAATEAAEAGGHRPHLARPLSAQDFPVTRPQETRLRGRAVLASSQVPSSASTTAASDAASFGSSNLPPSLRPLPSEALVEAQVSQLNQEHQERRRAEERIRASVARSVAAFTQGQARREEEVGRKQQESKEEKYRAEEAASAVHGGATTRDSRKANSHADVQLAEAAEEALNGPTGLSKRPTTAARNKGGRYSGAFSTANPHVCHGPQCSHAASSDPTSISLLHQHPSGAAALSMYTPSPAAAAPAAPLPLPFRALDGHYTTEAWSVSLRSEGQADELARSVEAGRAQKQREVLAEEEEDEDPTISFEGGAGMSRIKSTLEAEERRRREGMFGGEGDTPKERAARREALKLKTDVWGAETLGIVSMGESAADHTVAALRAKQAALARIGTSLGRTPSHDVAFNTSVVKRKENPPVKAVKTKVADASPTATSSSIPSSGPDRARPSGPRGRSPPRPASAAPVRAASAKKSAPARPRPAASVASTLSRAQELVEPRSSTHRAFVDKIVHSDESKTARERIGESQEQLGGKHRPVASFSAFRPEQDEQARRARSSARPSSSSVGGDGSAAPASRLRPTSAALLGHAAAHPELLKNAPARAAAVSGLMGHIHSHVSQSEGLKSVQAIRDRVAHSNALSASSSGSHPPGTRPIVVPSRSTLERALLAPAVPPLTGEARRAMLPRSSATHALPEHPFPDMLPKKKKKKGTKKKGKKGSSKKKKTSSSGSKKKASASPLPLAEGLAFPAGSSSFSQFAGNPLVSDLALIHLEDLLGPAADESGKSALRSVLLTYAAELCRVFEMFSARAGGDQTGPALMNQVSYWQLLHVAGVFEPAAISLTVPSLAAAPSFPSRLAYEILVDDDDLAVERLDVDELLPRPAWIERMVRVAVETCGSGGGAGTSNSATNVAHAMERFIQRYLVPNVLSASPRDFRLRLVSPSVQSVLSAHTVPLQTLFSHYAHEAEGVVTLGSIMQMLRECDVSAEAMEQVEAAMQQTMPHVHASQLATGAVLLYPELMEFIVRLAALSSPAAAERDLAAVLDSFLQSAWSSFSERVPAAMATASALSASHSAAATARPASSSGRVTFA